MNEVTNIKTFLVQRICDDGTRTNSLMRDTELGKYLDFNDLYNESYEIYDVSKFGEVQKCAYKGWQPGCLIQVVNLVTNEIVLSYIGEDH